MVVDEAGDYSWFVKCWDSPKDGIRGFLLRFLASKDEIDQHIAVWTLTQLLESNGTNNPRASSGTDFGGGADRQILKLIRQTPQATDLLKTILRESTALDDSAVGDDSDFEDASDGETVEEGNEVLSLTKAALLLLKKLPSLEELEKGSGKGVEVIVPSGEPRQA